MAKTIAKLQARARKTSRKNAVASRVKPKARPKQTFNVSHFRAEDFRGERARHGQIPPRCFFAINSALP